jgi:hypothetical protein
MAEFSRKSTEWGLAVAYLLFLVLGYFLDWLTGKPKASVQDVIELGTFFVLLGIGGLLWGIYDLRDRIGPPPQ